MKDGPGRPGAISLMQYNCCRRRRSPMRTVPGLPCRVGAFPATAVGCNARSQRRLQFRALNTAITVKMDFKAASDRLTSGPSMTDLADRLGVSLDTLLRARTKGASPGRAPVGWEQALAELAWERAQDLQQLAEALELGMPEAVHSEAVPSQPFPYNVGTAT